MRLNRFFLGMAALAMTALTACGGGGSNPEPEVPLGTQIISSASGTVTAGTYLANDLSTTQINENSSTELEVSVLNTLVNSDPARTVNIGFFYDKVAQRVTLVEVGNNTDATRSYLCGDAPLVVNYPCPSDKIVVDLEARTIRFKKLQLHEHNIVGGNPQLPAGTPVNSLVIEGQSAWKAPTP